MPTSPSAYLIRCPSCGTENRVPAASEGQHGKCGNCHRALPPLHTRPVTLTDRTFDSFVEGYGGPVLVEFWAPW